MKDNEKSREQLVEEIEFLRERVATVEVSSSDPLKSLVLDTVSEHVLYQNRKLKILHNFKCFDRKGSRNNGFFTQDQAQKQPVAVRY